MKQVIFLKFVIISTSFPTSPVTIAKQVEIKGNSLRVQVTERCGPQPSDPGAAALLQPDAGTDAGPPPDTPTQGHSVGSCLVASSTETSSLC